MSPADSSDRSALVAKVAAKRPRVFTAGATEGGFIVEVDGRPMRTPAGLDLRLPTLALAETIAAELAAHEAAGKKDSSALPHLRMAATALDRVAAAREETVEAMASYATTELLCYRADYPEDLAARQHGAWQPLLDWAENRYAARLVCIKGIMPQPQPEEALRALRDAVATYDDLRLTGLAMAVQTCGSLVLGLALAEGRIDAAEAFELAELDESYQIEKWGEDEEATRRRAARRGDLAEAAAFLRLLTDPA